MARQKSQQSEKESAIKPDRQTHVRVMRMEDSSEPPESAVDDSGLSLEDLGQAYAALLNRGAVPYEEPQGEAETDQESELIEGEAEDPVLTAGLDAAEPMPVDDAACELSPKSIFEAILFVGHPQNEPLTASQVASLMRGVLPEEIHELVRELNEQYVVERCPYIIASAGSGYRLVLREEFASVRDHFYGRVKEARLSQSSIDTLAIVAYHQPVTVKDVDELRGKPSGGVLSQLVRRQLVKIERGPTKPRELIYRTTSRFLDLFGLESLEDLPLSQDLER